MNYDELVVFIIRETGWPLEYIREMDAADINLLVSELSYQKKVDDYNRNYSIATIAAILTSDKNHKRRPEDFIGMPPERGNDDQENTSSEASDRQD